MKRTRVWPGTVCCFILFLVVFILHKLSASGYSPVQQHLDLGMLCFLLPGMIASFVSRDDRLFKPLFGAMLAAPVCLLLVFFTPIPERSVLQEVAWLFGAVFWCGLGALCHLVARKLLKLSD